MKSKTFFLILAAILPVDGATLRTVCASGCQYALNQVQRALDDAACGDVIEIQAGQNATTSEGLTLRNKGCASGVYTLIRSSALDQLIPNQRIRPATDANKLAKLTSSSGVVLKVDQAASYYRLEGMELTINPGQDPFNMVQLFTETGGTVAESQISQLPHHLDFDRCWIHGTVESHGVFSRCVAANTGELTMTNSVVNDCFDQNIEAQALAGWNALGPFYFRNNQFSGSQIATMFGGSTPTIPGLRATGLYYLGNYYYRPWTWRGTSGSMDPSGACRFDVNGGESYVNTSTNHCWRCSEGSWTDQGASTCPVTALDKNQFELKNAWGAFVEGNVLQNGWRPAMLNQKGAAFLFNQVDTFEPSAIVAHVNIQNNLGINTPWIVNVGLSGPIYDRPMHDITFDNNLFTNIGPEPQSMGDAASIQTTYTGRFRFSHNTVLFGRDNESFGGFTGKLDGVTDYVEFFGNILPYGGLPVGLGSGGFFNTFSGAGGLSNAIQTAWSTGSSIFKNVIVNNKGCLTSTDPAAVPCPVQNILQPDGSGRVACPSCSVPRFTENGGVSDVGFANYASGNYRLAASSAYKNWSGLGRDAGADVDKVIWATAGAVAGGWNPYLDFHIANIFTTPTGAQVTLKSPTTEACTTTVAANWLFTNPVFTNTDVGGDVDRVIAVTGLTPDTRYWVKVECGSPQYRRDDVFYTNRSGPNNVQAVVSPTAAIVRGGQQQQFSAEVFGILNQAVTWSVEPSVGSINNDGLYTAPGSIGAPQLLMVVATASDGVGRGTASLTLLPPPVGAATFVMVDTTTSGSWKTVYGADGANVIGNATQYPSYVTVTPSGKEDFTWAASTAEPRGLQKLTSATDRIAATWYSSTSFTIDIQFNDRAPHRVAFYSLDWDTSVRNQTMEILDGAFNNVLDTRNLANYHNGAYVVWDVIGHVKLRVTNGNGSANAVVAGLFFGPPI